MQGVCSQFYVAHRSLQLLERSECFQYMTAYGVLLAAVQACEAGSVTTSIASHMTNGDCHYIPGVLPECLQYLMA